MTPYTITLTELQYSTDTRGPLRLYMLRADGYHTGAISFHQNPKCPDAQINAEQARRLAERHRIIGLEVRITNGGDFLVYHANGGTVLYPPDPETFWQTAGASDAEA